jgi:hypothetical protein
MLVIKRTITLISICALFYSALEAQVQQGQNITWQNGTLYTVTTAVPFLRINPDARAGGMGDVGIATSPDANAVYINPAKLAFIEDADYGFSASFSPWLKSLVSDIYLASLNGFYKVKKQQTIAFSLRYFSLGSIQFTDINGTNTQQFRPNEFALDVHYARILSKYFSISASIRYIYSNLASGSSVDGIEVKPGQAGAGDIAWYFHKTWNENEAKKMQHGFSAGMDISNIGSKMTYTSNIVKDYLPCNLGIGFGYTLDIDKHNTIGPYLDLNKLLVPSPLGAYDTINNTYFYKEQSSVKGIFTSFGDAPAIQELRYINVGIGGEYYYNKQFGIRFGYFYENPTAGGREYLTAGLTVKYSVVALSFSYLIPTTIIRNPLDNTLRFTLVFNFQKGGKRSSGENSGISLVNDNPTPKKKKKDEDNNTTPTQTTPTQTPPPAQPGTTPK